jgi:hypothetical protein
VNGAYANQPHTAIVATLGLLRHFRAFLESPCKEMRDPYEIETWHDGAARLDKPAAARKLRWLIHMAISRKAGGCLPINDSSTGASLNHRGAPRRKESADYLRALGYDARALNTPRLRIYSITTPELRVRFAHRIARYDD